MSDKPPGKRVLLVDDDRALLSLIGLFLERAGYTVEYAADGSEAWNRFQEAPCDIVVLDRMMPIMSGDELTQHVKSVRPEVPIILITGFIQGAPHRELYEAILVKPFHAQDLVAAIERILHSRGV